MNTKAYLRDWQEGDEVTAEDLQDLVSTVAMLEAAAPGGGGIPTGAGGVRRLTDGPVEMPWQVCTVAEDSALALQVVPGRVMVGIGEEAAGVVEATLAAGEEKVQDFDPLEACIVWLELTGTVSTARCAYDGSAASDTYNGRYQSVSLEAPALRVTCKPADDALRVWALAAYNPTHEQKITQLAWGDLSALECRGVLDEAGEVVWPTDRSEAAAWTEEAHREGMATLCGVDATHDTELIMGTLSGCLDLDGALEFFAGPTQEEVIDPDPDPDPWTPGPPTPDPPDPDEPDPDNPDDPYTPVYPDPPDPDDPDPEPVDPTWVKYGYMAGEGFASCTLVNNAAGTNLSWRLELDVSYMTRLLSGLQVPGQVSFSAGGSSPGIWATVSMGLSGATASASGLHATGSTGLAFQGTTGDASVKSATAQITYTASPSWQPAKKTWLLPADSLHDAGSYVIRESCQPASDSFVEAGKWYRFRINASALKKHAQNYFRSQLAAVSLSGSDSSSSSDSTVSATLSGTLLNPSLSLTLS